MSLDDRSFLLKHDPKGMYQRTLDFPAQCRDAVERGRSASLPTWSAKPDVVVLTGMGGSAAGGDFVKGLFDEEATIPFFVNRDYTLPNWVGAGALVFATSYSGNTEETIASYMAARSRGANIIVVTSGGKLADLAREDGFPLILIPGGQPPRTALGYLLMPVLVACEQLGLIPAQDYEGAAKTLESCIADWAVEKPESENEAKQLARLAYQRPVTVYGLGHWQGAAAGRWKGQICENAKCMCFAHTFPELCHNEILGWKNSAQQSDRGWLNVILADGKESAKMEARGRVSAELIEPYADVRFAYARGESLLERMLTMVYLGDFVSLYLAALYETDPEEIDLINKLKAEMAKVP